MTRSRMKCLTLALAAACMTLGSEAWALKVGRLSVDDQDGRRLLTVATAGKVEPVLQSLDKKLVIGVPGGERAMGTLKVGKSPLRQIRFGREGKELRIVLDLDRDVAAKVVSNGPKGFVVDLGPVAAEASAKAAAGAAAAAPAAAVDSLNPALAGYTCRVVDISLGGDETHSELVVTADGPASYKPSVKEGGRLVSLTFRNASLAWSGEPAKLKDDAIQSVALHQLNAGGEASVRMDVRLNQKLDYTLQRDQNQLVLRFSRPEKAAAAPKTGDLEAPISLAVQDADLVGVLKTLSDQAGFEYQFTQSLLALGPPSSLVTVKIEHRPFREVIDTLLGPVNFNYLLQGNTLFFGSNTEIDLKKGRLPLVQRTYSPKYLTVDQSKAMLVAHFKRPDQLALGTKVADTDPRDPSRLLLVGTSEDVAQVLAALARYDVPESGDASAASDQSGGGLAKTQVFTLQYLTADDEPLLQAAIKQLYEPTKETPPTPYLDKQSRTLVVTTQVKYLRKIEKLLQRIDVRPLMVNIEGKIVEVDQGQANQLGVQWSATNNGNNGSTLGGDFNTGIASAFLSRLSYGTVQNGLNITSSLDYLVNQNKADLVSAPNITTRDNVPAKISINDTVVSVQTTTSVTNGVVTAAQTYTQQQIPLKLDVTPVVNRADHRVALGINFTLTTQSGSPASVGALVPTTDETAETTVNVASGETAVIGGLVRQNNTEEERKIPVLGDIPLLGLLFKYNTQSKQKKEIIIFITPTIVED